jgi:hypothetical protein
MTRFCLLNGIDGECADGVDAQLIDFGCGYGSDYVGDTHVGSPAVFL